MGPSAEILRLPPPNAAHWARAARHEQAVRDASAQASVEATAQSARESLDLGRDAMQFASVWTGDVPAFLAHAFVDNRDWTVVARDPRLYGSPAATAYAQADRLGGQGAMPLYDVLA